jgi:hypothetical protein
MKKTVFFTIITKSYLPLAKVLFSSIKNNNLDNYEIECIAVIIDGDDKFNYENQNEFCKLLSGSQLYLDNENLFRSLSFKYDISEFCTCIKPRVFEYLFETNLYENIFYFDPDICVFDNISFIVNSLEGYFFSLTPHCLTPDVNQIIYKQLLGSGTFNLGFLGVANDPEVLDFIFFWKKNCEIFCFRESSENLFTDQKWIDLIFSFYPNNKINIVRDFSFNVAPWNSFERNIIYNDGAFEVGYNNNSINQKLLFYHFSGFDYSNLDLNINEKFTLRDGCDLKLLLENYKVNLNKFNINEFINLGYKHNTFLNGQIIAKLHRRLYRNMLANNLIDISANPYHDKTLMNIQFDFKKVDKKNDISNIRDYNMSQLIIEKLSRFCRIVIGWKNYLLLLKYLKYFSKFENQLFQVKAK